jgi:hypothetical protein
MIPVKLEIIFLVVLLIISLFMFYYYFVYISEGFSDGLLNGLLNGPVFKAPNSLTILNQETGISATSMPGATSAPGIAQTNAPELSLSQILATIPSTKVDKDGNTLEYPSFFNAMEKWPGCLPRPLFQGSCGSCWAFASVTVLSSRFYIETCGLSGCRNYPQINFGSINNVNYNINEIYKFRKLFLTDIFNNIDLNKEGYLTKDEWTSVIMDYQKTFKSEASPYFERHQIAQILVYILNFQSLGSIDLTNSAKVRERADEAFDIWVHLLNRLIKREETLDQYKFAGVLATKQPEGPADSINIERMKSFWLNEPVTLSAEKLISCCNSCQALDFKSNAEFQRDTGNPVCLGSTLNDAWSILRESGTPTADCIGYNLDNWSEGSYSPTCKEVQGPLYSFCSGYVIDKSNFQLGDRNGQKSTKWSTDVDALIKKYEDSGINPIAIPSTEKDIPWVDPQLFRFRAKNVYKVNPTVTAIQREILERGPVTTGFTMYLDFQYEFGTNGGQLYTGGNTAGPLGSSQTSLIYRWSGRDSAIGGHSVVIVGWGTYHYVDASGESYQVPYWTCLNSWGYKWGTSGLSRYDDRTGLPDDMTAGGYFWILRGTDECSIESNVIVGQPDINNISYPKVSAKYGWGLPPPDTKDVAFIKQENLDGPIDIGPNNVLVYNKPLDGGGSFTFRDTKNDVTTWSIESMQPPSPFVLFWNSSRPIYCIGTVLNDLSENSTDQVLKVSDEAYLALGNIVKLQTNPLLVVDDEQMQLLSMDTMSNVKVLRGINNSYISRHKKGSELKVMPFKNLSVTDLDKISHRCTFETVAVE